MQIEFLLIGSGTILLILVIGNHIILSRSIRSTQKAIKPKHYPSVTVVRPIKGLDAGAEENIEAAFDHGYPGKVELIFVFDDDTEPAIPLVEKAILHEQSKSAPTPASIVFCGQPPAGRTGKLNAMIAGLAQAQGELVAFADSDIRPDDSALSNLVETLLADKKAGAAFAPVVVKEKPKTIGDAGYAMLLNGFYGAEAAWASHRRGGTLEFIMGQFMLFRRDAIEAIGGLQSADGQLVDDMYLGLLLTRAGFHNRVASVRVPIVQYGLTFREFIGIFIRWITFSRTGFPEIEYKIQSIIRAGFFYSGLTLALASAWFGFAYAALVGISVSLAQNTSFLKLHNQLASTSGDPRTWLAPFVVLLFAPIAFASVLLRRQVNWRGRKYDLDNESRLLAQLDER